MAVRPINYNIEFEPDLKRMVFEGVETIKVESKEPVSRITLNSAELVIGSCQVSQRRRATRSTFKTVPKNETLTIRLGSKISGRFEVRISFSGILNDRLLGFYKSRYERRGPQYIATTQFEAADARRAFPCWDEPAAKATFDISITADEQYMAVSNMPEKASKKVGKRIRHTFATTPPMSTYLVYLGVGRFEYLSGMAGRTKIRVLTTPGNKSRGRFALDIAKRLLPEYERYFGVKYPLPKLDLLAIPDFAAGAMENWGAITFRETILLYDAKTSSAGTKQLIAEVISHEIAHQWFGNLVTMKWWNDLWLNESFATFMATKFVDMFYPEWEMWEQFMRGAMNTAMELDALNSTHPIDVKVSSPAEIREIFDAISYDKGGCVLRMLENYVGEDLFKKGLKNYLARFSYGNASGKDLWRAIQKASGKPVVDMMDGWLRQPGFPLVEVESGDKMHVSQNRFTYEGGKRRGIWQIPIRTEDKTLILKGKKAKIAPTSLPINRGRYGFYRVAYDDGALKEVKKAVASGEISQADMWAVQNDMYALCVAGRAKVGEYLEIVEQCGSDNRYLVTSDIARNLYGMFLITYGDLAANMILRYTKMHFDGIMERLGMDGKKSDSQTDKMLRSFAITALVRLGEYTVADECATRFAEFQKNHASLQPDIREAVFAAVAWNGGRQEFKIMMEHYERAATHEEKMRFLSAMCSFQDPKLLKKTLNFSQTSSVRSQNMHMPIVKVAGNPHGKKILWPWLQKNWKAIQKKIGHGNPLLARIISSLVDVADPSMEKEIREFFKKNPVPGTERVLEQALEKIRIREGLRDSIRRVYWGD